MESEISSEFADPTLPRKTSSQNIRARTETDTGGQVENTKAAG
jgi:hypothetical protein